MNIVDVKYLFLFIFIEQKIYQNLEITNMKKLNDTKNVKENGYRM